MTKPILKLLRPSGSPIIEAFGTPCADTKFQGPSAGALNTQGWEKLAIFDG